MVTAAELVHPPTGRISRRIYVDQGIYEQELEKIFARCWLFLAHESQVPNPSDFVATYMGEDPVLVVRDSRGQINAFLNTCRHRGMRVCRADAGNAAAFTCTYHGWTYSNDGKLVGVPGYKEYYYEELDMEQWGLVSVAQVDSYKGLIFGTFDAAAPPLTEALGDMKYYMDYMFDRRDGGVEIVGGVHKWIMPCNWKFAADNFSGDGYHLNTTHISAMKVQGNPQAGVLSGDDRIGLYAGNGHAVTLSVGPGVPSSGDPAVRDYYAQTWPETSNRLGPLTSKASLTNGAATVFPNFSFLLTASSIRVWHPRGPERTEVWSWCCVDKEAPAAVKEGLRLNSLRTFCMAGLLEQDDGENWNMCTQSSRGRVARLYDFNYSMGLGHERRDEEIPGELGPRVNENQQRGFYDGWLKMMSA